MRKLREILSIVFRTHPIFASGDQADLMNQADDTIPKCRHGYIILGCPDEDCSEQNEYLAHQQEAMDAHYLRQELDAMKIVEWLTSPRP